MTDAFGVVAMVAMTPLITIQLLGLVSQLKTRPQKEAVPVQGAAHAYELLADDAIIEL